MMNFFKILFFQTMVIGTLITISSYNWFTMWIGLEINLMSIIPLFKANQNIYPAEATIKYFITQSLASTIILFSIILMMNTTEFLPQNYNYWIMMILNSALLMKLGAAPFHVWFPEVAEGLNWMNNMILLTWQKLAPMILIMYNLNLNMFISIIIILSSIISGILGINQISLRKILAYSSINHIAWMLASMLNFKMIWWLYFLIYSMISINIIVIFKNLNIYYLPQLFLSFNSNKVIKLFFIMNFFSLGGLPPFLGFLPKWLVLNNLMENNFYALSMILIICTLITLYFYIRITFSILTISMKETIFKQSKLNQFSLIIFNTINMFGIFICSSIFLML
uniref:NADH-ubiquinone oxidoreductase chain 2 n=1 Tax=Podagricomela nigricollis TaxID=2528270 RepID=A0A411NH23_9CUCU|nr:NADH dehydrogenase subunit 2 [Podagricomela nigricollis]QBF43998.1 NADH dehydrogenase subunit 2 [Podagricomela nigricollis]